MIVDDASNRDNVRLLEVNCAVTHHAFLFMIQVLAHAIKIQFD